MVTSAPHPPSASAGRAIDDSDRELERVVDRLRTMPLHRLDVAAPLTDAACRAMLAVIHDEHDLPHLGTHAAGDKVAVIATDALGRARDDDARARIAAILTELRRSLP